MWLLISWVSRIKYKIKRIIIWLVKRKKSNIHWKTSNVVLIPPRHKLKKIIYNIDVTFTILIIFNWLIKVQYDYDCWKSFHTFQKWGGELSESTLNNIIITIIMYKNWTLLQFNLTNETWSKKYSRESAVFKLVV